MAEFKDFIGIWKNNINVDDCNKFIEWYDFADENNFVVTTEQETGVRWRIDRKDESFVYPNSSQFAMYHFPAELNNGYMEQITENFHEYNDVYTSAPANRIVNPYFKIHKVKPGGGYHTWHYENSAWQFRDRFMAYMTYLKVPESGGETEFLHQSMRIEPEVGTTLMWPAGFTHQHRGNPPLKGEKMYITGWLIMTTESIND